MKSPSSLAYIRQLCCLGLDSELTIPVLLRELRAIVPYQCAVFCWIGSNGELRNLYSEPLDFYESLRDEHHAACVLGSAGTPVKGLLRVDIRPGVYAEEDLVVNAGAFLSAISWPVIAERLRLGPVIAAVAGDRGIAKGALFLVRAAGQPGFAVCDRQLLEGISLDLSVALTRRHTSRPNYSDTGAEGMIISDSDGSIRHLCAKARHLLILSCHSNLTLCEAKPDQIRLSNTALRSLLQRHSRYHDQPVASDSPLLQENRWGQFLFRSFRLEVAQAGHEPMIGIMVRHQVPLPLKLLAAMKNAPLSGKQKEVCLMLSDGLSHGEIAGQLNISIHTAIDHVRKIYQKMNVHSRDELLDIFLENRISGASFPAEQERH
ncbi:MAG: LuxR family transcriptional regulator [Gammaproteobacteria bacterium]|nr:MAG: LuxR family transcriptional regulator [Gammaproteobacteria bacterium]TND02264.1 MAG: LuxR family transcriptional regulator [Gammaproteobacteria bacterium]